MGLNRSPDIHWCHGQEYGLEEWVKMLDTIIVTSPKILPTNLFFDPTIPMIILDLDIIKINILSKFEEDWVKTVAARVLTRFY